MAKEKEYSILKITIDLDTNGGIAVSVICDEGIPYDATPTLIRGAIFGALLKVPETAAEFNRSNAVGH